MDSKTKRYFLRTAMLLLLMALTSISAWAETVNGVKYIKYDSENEVYAEATQNDVTVLTGSETTLTAGWYVVIGNVNYNSYLYTEANEGEDVNIILSDGATLTVGALTSNSKGRERLSIYGQSQGTGTANISRSLMGCYSLTIYGGIINANILDCAQGGVGIYGGTVNAGSIEPYGSVRIYGGNVTVTGEIETVDKTYDIVLGGGTVKASSYKAARVCIQKGLTYYDGTGASYSGTIEYYQNLLDLKPDEITAIAGKTLRTYDYRDGTCGDPNVNEGKNVTWLYNIATRTLTISGAGAMADFSSKDNQPWKDNRDNITTVVIKNGVTSIGGNAFYGCSSLTSVTVCATACTLGNGAFDGCAILFQLTKKNAGTESQSTTYYTTLGDAVNAAADGDKITLLKDYTITVSRDNVTTDTRGVSINKSITLDLNDHNITRDNTKDIDEYAGKLISIDAGATLTLVDNGADKGTMGSIENQDVFGGHAIVVGNGSTLNAKGVKISTYSQSVTVGIDGGGTAVIDDCVIQGDGGINLLGTATITNSDISGGNKGVIQVGEYYKEWDGPYVIHTGHLTIGDGVYFSEYYTPPYIDYVFGTVILKALPTFGQHRPTTSSTTSSPTRAKARAKTREGEIPYDIGMRPGLSLTFEEGTFETPGQPMRIYIKDNDVPVDPATYTNPITTNYSKYVKGNDDKVIDPDIVFKWKENDFTRGFRLNTADEVIFDHAAATVTSYSGTTTPTTKPYYAYYDFSEAIAAANSGYKTASEAGGTEFIPTLKMLDDVSYDPGVVIGDGSTVTKVTLDLGPYGISGSVSGALLTINSGANLTIVGSGETAKIENTNTSDGPKAISNDGTLTINGVTVKGSEGILNDGTLNITDTSVEATNSYGDGICNNGSLTMSSSSVRSDEIGICNEGSLTLTSGNVKGYQYAISNTIYAKACSIGDVTFVAYTGIYIRNDVTFTAWPTFSGTTTNIELDEGKKIILANGIGAPADDYGKVSVEVYMSSNENLDAAFQFTSGFSSIDGVPAGTLLPCDVFGMVTKQGGTMRVGEKQGEGYIVPVTVAQQTLMPGWNTWIDDKSQAVGVSAEGIATYAVTQVAGDAVSVASLPDGLVEAGMPILIYNGSSEIAAVGITSLDNEYFARETSRSLSQALGSSAETSPCFQGTVGGKTLTASDDYDYFGCNGEAFVSLDLPATVGAHRCWLALPKSSGNGGSPSGTRSLTIGFGGDGDGTTGVREIKEVREVTDDTWYTLEGLKLSGRPQKKGIYVHGGRKVAIK